jgi:phosphoglucosamine mutase
VAIAKSLLSSKGCKKKILFGADTRESCILIISLISQGLNKESCEISNAGIVPTPAVAYYSKKENFDLGIMVSASHNSYQDNGIKIFNNNGFKISFDDENYIENYIETILNQDNLHDKSKVTIQDISKKVEQDYIKFCLQTLKGKIFKKNRITLDLANGANYKIARKVFTEAGFDISVHNDNPNGKNINDKCGSTYINKLPELIKSDESDFGISMDGDGDRLVVVDKNSRVLDGDDILYTIVR